MTDGGPLFEVASFAITPRALDLLLSTGHDPWDLLERHQSGDWGSVEARDRSANEEAVRTGGPKRSVFRLGEVFVKSTICGEALVDAVVQITDLQGFSTIFTLQEQP